MATFKGMLISAVRSQRTFNSGNRSPRCAGVKGEAEGHVLQIKIQRCRLFLPEGKGAAHSASVGVANHHKLLDTRDRGRRCG